MTPDLPSHKKRTVADLIRFIGNTSDSDNNGHLSAPNYSILLGAGASVTSGVRSGQELVRDWKRQVYEESNKDAGISIEDFFKPGRAPLWYVEDNSYAVLFENRYDLQRHRRMFVEHEVSQAKPSMGYAYLVKLIENGFFNTVFTTNFDDLLNEAFYRFSNNRPIVCAHDSSISGVTVTSARPKIIKLHGDYLFEDIKATLRETESLETNMKLKFQEFAKDFGLIVIGYSGQDRSVMDILNYLLQKEDFFKNGIFWCIKKGENMISNDLKKLLWHERVYYVEIEGFDELFAELNLYLNNGALPVDDTFLSRKHQERIIRELTETSHNAAEDSVLSKDCKRLKYDFENSIQNDYLAYVKKQRQEDSKKREYRNVQRKNNLKKMNPDQKRDLDDLMTEGFILRRSNAVLQRLNKMDIFSMEDSQYKLELIELQADLTERMDDEEIKKLFDELIRLDPDNERYYEISANRTKSDIVAIHYLEMAVNRFPNDAFIINKLVERKLDYCEGDCSQDDLDNELQTIWGLIGKSLLLAPYPDNDVYLSQYRYICIKYKNKIDELKEEKKKLYLLLKEKAPFHPQTICIMRMMESKFLDDDFFMNAIEYNIKADLSKNVEKCYCEFIKWNNENGCFDKVLSLIDEYEKKYSGSNIYRYVKASVLMDNEYLEDALSIIEELPLDDEISRRKLKLLILLSRNDEAKVFFESSEFIEDLKPYYYSLIRDYTSEKDYYDKLIKTKERLTISEAVSYAYVLLQCNDYDGVIKLLKPYYDNPLLAEGPVIVNYLYARKQKGEDVTNKVKAKILENKFIEYSDLEKLGAYCVIADRTNAYSRLVKVIKKEPLQKYDISEWPILAQFVSEERFKKVLLPSPKQLVKNILE